MKKLTITLFSAILLIAFSGFKDAGETYKVDTSASELKWTGYHLAKSYEHQGNIKLKSGKLSVADGKIASGEFVIDMNTITNNDLTSEKDNKKLVNHLKSDDFFNVKAHPEAKLVIKKSEASGNGVLKVTGDLAIRGITKTVEFDATLKELGGGKIEAIADLKVQRTDFKVMYGWKVENAMLSGEFRMEIKVIAKK